MITVLLADDQAMVRGAMAALLELEGDITVVGQVGRGDEVVAEALRTRPEVVLMDVDMPGLDGLAATPLLLQALPGVKVLVVTTFGRPGFLRRALDCGAHGFIVKDAPAAQLAETVRRVHAGLRVVDPQLAADSLLFGESPLTPREADVLATGADGATIQVIAKRLHLSEGTVRNHLSAAIGKTAAGTRAEAIRIAIDRGWIVGP
ncbi:MAG: response regulator transcription factor [Acidipropionibacterium sp.]|jgi:two-component system response regulator DesR|nr:response regulator transcription factor [Acidipropionibacterium sp.]